MRGLTAHAGARRPSRGRGIGLRRTMRTPAHTGREHATDPTTVKGINPLGDAAVAQTWRGLHVTPESRCSPYRASDYSYPQSIEGRIVESLDGIWSPYTGRGLRLTRVRGGPRAGEALASASVLTRLLVSRFD